MSAFASYASSLNSPNNVLPSIQTAGTEGSTYKYESRGGKRKSRSSKMRKSKIIKRYNNKSKSIKRSRRR